jgi:hypothetical protein
MISEDVRARIRRLFFAEHWKIGTIAAELGVHRDAVACAVDTSRFSNCRFRGDVRAFPRSAQRARRERSAALAA